MCEVAASSPWCAVAARSGWTLWQALFAFECSPGARNVGVEPECEQDFAGCCGGCGEHRHSDLVLDLLNGRERGHLHACGQHEGINVVEMQAAGDLGQVFGVEMTDGDVVGDLEADGVAHLDVAVLDVVGDGLVRGFA